MVGLGGRGVKGVVDEGLLAFEVLLHEVLSKLRGDMIITKGMKNVLFVFYMVISLLIFFICL